MNKDEVSTKLSAQEVTSKNIENKKIISVASKNILADYHAESIKLLPTGTEFRICCSGHKISIKSQLLGEHLVNSSIFAFALADILQISLIKVGKSLEKLASYPGRMNIVKGKKGTTIIDDTYNANPSSVMAALITLSEITHNGRKVLILGNMNEMGALEEKVHREVGSFAKDRCDFAIFVGPNAALMQKGYGDNNSSAIFKNRQELKVQINSLIEEKDLILVKASQNGNYFEEVVKELMQNQKEAAKLLVRQGKDWLRKKN